MHSFVEVEYLVSLAGAKTLFSEHFNQDPLESFGVKELTMITLLLETSSTTPPSFAYKHHWPKIQSMETAKASTEWMIK